MLPFALAVPGGVERQTAWLPILAPLALLCALDALTCRLVAGMGVEIVLVRMGAALFATASLGADGRVLPACITGWIDRDPRR